jgi:hypothetical protein
MITKCSSLPDEPADAAPPPTPLEIKPPKGDSPNDDTPTRKKRRGEEHDRWITKAKELAQPAKDKTEKPNVSAIARSIAKRGKGRHGDLLDDLTVRRILFKRSSEWQ